MVIKKLTYYCVKCKKNHQRGFILESHKIYDQTNSIEITPEIKAKPWIETCHDCLYGDGDSWTSCAYLKLEGYQPKDYTIEIYRELIGDIGGSIPKPCFRVPRTSPIYRKCKYHQKKEVK